jgi:hypothetical protein
MNKRKGKKSTTKTTTKKHFLGFDVSLNKPFRWVLQTYVVLLTLNK